MKIVCVGYSVVSDEMNLLEWFVSTIGGAECRR